jgi:hypothetical protein
MLTQDDYIKLSAEVIQNNIDKISTGFINLGKDQFKKSQIKTKGAFKSYLDTAIKKYSYVKTILHKLTPAYIYDVYVNTNLKIEDQYLSTEDINEIFEISRSTLITGTGGCGKSTLLKHLFLNSLEKCNCIPIYIELNNVKNYSKEFNLMNYIFYSLKAMNFELEEEYLEYAFANCNILLILDGFDEVDDTKVESVTNDILALSTKYENLYTIVSSRPTEKSFTSWTNFSEMCVMPMDKQQSLDLISKVKYDKIVKNNFMQDLENRLYDQFMSFASNPLLLTIMLITYTDYAEIPDKIHLFYEEAFEVLYRKHDANKEGVFIRVFKTNLSKDQFVKILACISLISYYENHYSFRKNEITSYIERAKKLTKIEFNSEDYLADLIQSVCIMQLDGLTYTYTHRSFQEYFTAFYILSCSSTVQIKLLKKLPCRYVSDNVLSLLFDMNKDMLEENLIIPVLTDLKDLIKYTSSLQKQNFLDFLKLDFDGFRFIKKSNVETEPGNVALKILLRNKKKTSGFDKQFHQMVNFVCSKYASTEYRSIPIIIKTEIFENDYRDKVFNIEILDENEELYNYVYTHINKLRNNLCQSMDLLDKLISEHKNRQESLDSLLS